MPALRCILAVLLVAVATPLWAQTESAAVSGTGYVDIERPPNIMRMEIVVQTKGTTTEEALQKLNDRLGLARESLKSLDALADSISSGEPSMQSAENDRQLQLQIRVLEQMRRNQGGPAQKISLPPSVTLSSKVSAEWKLKGTTPDELLLEASSLQQRVHDADLAGTIAGENISPEERRIMQELEDTGYSQWNEQFQAGQPRFIFASKILEEEYKKSLAEAFQKAKQKASRLAAAAGAELGGLRSLTDLSRSIQGSDDSDWSDADVDAWTQYANQYAQAATVTSKSDEPEALGTQPTKVSYRVAVTATFGLK